MEYGKSKNYNVQHHIFFYVALFSLDFTASLQFIGSIDLCRDVAGLGREIYAYSVGMPFSL